MEGASSANPLRVGPFVVDVTPQAGNPIAYGEAAGIDDPLRADGVVLRGADRPVVLAAVDWIGNSNAGYDAWRERLAAAVGDATATAEPVKHVGTGVADVSLDSLDYRNRRRTEYRDSVNEAIADVPELEPVETYPKSESGGLFGGVDVRYRPEALDGVPADRFVAVAAAEGIPIRGPGCFHPEHLRTIYREEFDL
jgi:hypothetical protein